MNEINRPFYGTSDAAKYIFNPDLEHRWMLLVYVTLKKMLNASDYKRRLCYKSKAHTTLITWVVGVGMGDSVCTG